MSLATRGNCLVIDRHRRCGHASQYHETQGDIHVREEGHEVQIAQKDEEGPDQKDQRAEGSCLPSMLPRKFWPRPRHL